MKVVSIPLKSGHRFNDDVRMVDKLYKSQSL